MILDNDVVSEVMRAEPDPKVVAWLRRIPGLVLTTITVGEIRYGLSRLPVGRRRTLLERAFADVIRSVPSALALDEAAAIAYGHLRAERDAAGRPITVEDAMIAAIALTTGQGVATGNTSDFEGLGLALVNPWE